MPEASLKYQMILIINTFFTVYETILILFSLHFLDLLIIFE